MTTWFLPESALQALLEERRKQPLFGPTQTDKLSWIDSIGEEVTTAPLRTPRSAQSPKGFFLPATELLGKYGLTRAKGAAVAEVMQITLLGVRACELRARNYLDKVLREGDFKDPAYLARREATTVISVDCVDCTESCCCTLVSGRPYVEEGYDVNLSPIEGGYVADAATAKGEAWLGDVTKLGGRKADDQDAAWVTEMHETMLKRLEDQNERFTYRGLNETPANLPEIDDPSWQKHAADCVECGACTHICPTCHCFYLYDQVSGKEAFERVRNWDSCLLSSYNRMAGGVHMKLSPKPDLYSRLANRVLHKFTYSQQQWHMMGCVGCGRCIDACPGKIDIREVVQDLGK